jgi:hypothetical protein
MAAEDIKLLKERLTRDAKQFAEGGYKIVMREEPTENSSLRAAANQFRQAVMALDQLDGLEQTLHYLKAK